MYAYPAVRGPCANYRIGLKSIITEDGVWRIRKREKVPKLELYKLEESGHGDILSPNFVRWRTSELPGVVEAKASASKLSAAINGYANGTTNTGRPPSSLAR
jgi:hypothetical protein